MAHKRSLDRFKKHADFDIFNENSSYKTLLIWDVQYKGGELPYIDFVHTIHTYEPS